MSERFSPDGLYYWDGQRWLSTLSPDGRFRWNGSAWMPTGSTYASPGSYQPPSRPQRMPTSWTKPLQYAVVAWYALSAIYAFTLPFTLGGPMADLVGKSLERQQRMYPNASPPPPEFTAAMGSFMSGLLWVSALLSFAICLLVIVGALNRWTWLYYAVLVLLGFSLLGAPYDVIILATGSNALSYGVAMPSWLYWTGLLFTIPDAALFAAMLYALVKRGPWGMTKPLPSAG